MPRGRKAAPKTIEERLALVRLQLEKHQTCINDLKDEEKHLLKEKDNQELKKIQDALKSTGMSVNDLIETIKAKNNDDEDATIDSISTED